MPTRTGTPPTSTPTRTPPTATPTNTVPVPAGCNPTPITLNAFTSATPYPSNINIAAGVIVTDVNVTLLQASHTWPDNIDVLLVSPGGQKVLVWSDAGGSGDIVNVNLTFDDSAPAPIPDKGPVTAGTYQPSNYEGNNDQFDPPAPPPPYSTTLSAFNGSLATGTWSLYIMNDSGLNVGTISGGWCLYINTASPPTTPIPTRTPMLTPIPTGTPTAAYTPTQAPTQTPTQTPAQATQTPTQLPAPTPPTSTPTVTACSIEFDDVPQGSTFYTYIQCLACRGIIGGYNDGTFRPNNDITRGQIAKIVSESGGFDDDPGSQVYEDVPQGNPFHPYINRLTNRGFVGGYECGQTPGEPCVPPDNRPYFRPNASATRGQLSKIVATAANISDPVSGQRYQDVPPSNPFYVWIEQLSGRGVMGGYPCGGPGEPCDLQNRPYFRWANNVTRGQASKIVANTFFPGCSPARGR